MIEGVVGLDREVAGEPVKSAAELTRFLEAENLKIANKCSACERIQCSDCKYQSTQLSINEQEELEQIFENISIVDNPDLPGRKMFAAQYVWGPGVNPYEAFKRSDSNYSQVKKSALALRRRLHQMDRLEEFDSLVKKEEESNYIVRIDEELDFYLGNLPECWI